jgi:tRNA isopentenyl-2-thiomethyl-A-37 hydroxylase MiaE
LADVQRALNLIRKITSEERAAVRLEVVRLMASAIADEARDIEQRTAPKQKQRRAVPSVPMPKSPNAPKLQQAVPKQSSQQQQQQPNTQPIQAIKPIAPK